MQTFLDLLFWFNFLYFTLVLYLALFIPGDIFVNRLHLSYFQRVIVSLVFGLVLWSLQGFFFGYLHLRWLSYIYVVVFFVIWIKKNYRYSGIKSMSWPKIDVVLLLIIVSGVVLQLISISLNGVEFKDGIYFCCGGPDIQFHTALTKHLISTFPPYEPGIAGVAMKNYHYLYNLSVADLIRIFKLPAFYTQWLYIPFYFSILIGLSTVVFSEVADLGRSYKRWLVFFIYFSGDLVYLLRFIYGLGLDFRSAFLQNAVYLWVSPSRVFGLIIFFIGLSTFVIWFKRKSTLSGVITSIIFGSLTGFKIYIAFFALSGYGILLLYFILRRNYKNSLITVVAFLLFLILYLPVNRSAGGLIFSGMWRFENFIAQQPSPISDLELRRMIYLDHNNWIRLIQYALTYIIMYVFFVFGTLNLAFIQTKKALSELRRELHIVLLPGFILSGVLGWLFMQKTGNANSVQFLISIQLFAPIYTALACKYWLKRLSPFLTYILIIGIIALTIPRVVYETYIGLTHILHHEGLFISHYELQALMYFKNNTDGSAIILQRKDFMHGRDRCIYITFMTDRRLYVCDDGAPEDRGVNIGEKEKLVETIYTSKNIERVKKALYKTKSDYIYLYSTDTIESTAAARLLFKPVFQNQEIKVMKILKN